MPPERNRSVQPELVAGPPNPNNWAMQEVATSCSSLGRAGPPLRGEAPRAVSDKAEFPLAGGEGAFEKRFCPCSTTLGKGELKSGTFSQTVWAVRISERKAP